MTRLPDRFVLRTATSDDVLAASSGVLRNATFVEDHYRGGEGGLRPEKGGLFCTQIFGRLDGSLEDDRRCDRFGHIELAKTMRHPWFETPLRHLAVLPPGYRRFQRTPEGGLAEHELTELYGRLIAINARLKRLVELGAPPPVVANDENEVRKDLARLFDNEGCGDEMFVANGRPLRGLAAHLETDDRDELGALLLAIGVVGR
jgi:DNA-directed RNA polymerase beta' subunit